VGTQIVIPTVKGDYGLAGGLVEPVRRGAVKGAGGHVDSIIR
jgi:hypothetical protein